MTKNQASYKGYIFDLDGTLYVGERLIPGADRVVRRLRAACAKVTFVSNKTVQTAADYCAKLNRLGVAAETGEVLTATEALLHRLKDRAGARLFVIGEPPLKAALRKGGFVLADDERGVDYVVVSLDRTFHYGKLTFAMRAIRNGAKVCAANPDRTCPVEGGEVPDAAATLAALEALTGASPEFVAGKPSPFLIQAAAQRMGLAPQECLMIGDRLETDVLMARRAGAAAALVLTGVTRREELAEADVKPDLVLDSVADLCR